jgi:uncharacterized protein YbcI
MTFKYTLLKSIVLAVVMLTVSPQTTLAETGELERFIQLAIKQNPDLVLLRSKARTIDLDKQTQDQWWARGFRGTINYAPMGGMGQTAVTPEGLILPMAVVGVGFNLGDILATGIQHDKNLELKKQVDAEIQKATFMIVSEVKKAYFEYEGTQSLLEELTLQRATVQANLRHTERLISYGQGNITMVNQARLELKKIDIATLTQHSTMKLAQSRLVELCADFDLFKHTHNNHNNTATSDKEAKR